MSNFEIHISDVRSFKQCRRKWDWSSPLRQNLERKITYSPFFLGKVIHYALQFYYENGETVVSAAQRAIDYEMEKIRSAGALWENEEDQVQEVVDLALGMARHYQIWSRRTKGPFSDDNLEVMAMEVDFDVPIETPSGRSSPKVHLCGRFDGLVRKKDDDTYWIFETKTSKSPQSLIDTLFNDEQCGAYIYAAQMIFDKHISGVLYNILRKKLPTEPEVLKNGDLTRRKNLDTTAQLYIEGALANHPDMDQQAVLDKYRDILNILLEKGNTFFARHAVYRTPHELEQLATDLHTVALEMTRSDVPLYPTPSWLNCKFCSFRAPCMMMNAGGDVSLILQEEYRERGKWDPMEGLYEGKGGKNGA